MYYIATSPLTLEYQAIEATLSKVGRFGDFVAIYRPFWNTGGEMGIWDDELMYTPLSFPYCDHLVLKLLTDRFSRSLAKPMLVHVLGLIE